VGNIVDSLFADYLPRKQQAPMRVADPRQQTMLTNQMLTPVMEKPVTPPNNYSINPPVNPLRSEFTQPTTQPPVVNSRPIYSNNPPIAPDYGFTPPTQPPAPVSNQTLTPVIPKPTPPTRDVPLFPSVGGIGGGTVPTQPPAAPVSDQTLTPVMPKPTQPPAAPVSSNSDIRYSFVPSDGNYDFGNNWSQPEQSPVMSKPTTPSLKAPQELINPVTTTEEKQQYDQLFGANVSGGVVPTEEETTDSFEDYVSTLTADDLANLDLSGVNLDNINVSSYEEINAALTGGSVAPTDLEGLSQLYQQQVSLLQNVDTLNEVDIDDRPYWYNTGVSGVLGQPSQYSGDEFRAATGLPDSFALYDSGQGLTQENAQRAMSLLSESASPLEAASQYYGIELQAVNNPNSNYNNASKYGTSPEKLAEFQSVIEPILQQVIPYLQVTQGLRYDDALEYAYKNDPMIAALYNQYGVDLFRQTDDGSTYFFDPISGTESRTVEVKDSTFRDVGLALTLTAGTLMLSPALSGAIANSAIGSTVGTAGANVLGNALASGLATGFTTGFDGKAMLDSMLQAGLTAGTIELLKTDGMREVLNSFGESIGVPTEFTDVETFMQETYTETTPVMGLGDTIATLVGGNEEVKGTWQSFAEGFDEAGNAIGYITKPFFFDKTLDALINLIPESFLETLDPALLKAGRGIGAVADVITGQTGGGAGGSGGGNGAAGGTAGIVRPLEDEEDKDTSTPPADEPPPPPPPPPPPAAEPPPPPAAEPPPPPPVEEEEVVDVFDDGGLTGDAFEDSTVEDTEEAEDVAVDVTDTEEYRDLQEELNTTRANQETLETTVAGLQDEVAAANEALQQAQAAADAAEAAGAANADKLRGEAVAAQANAERVQSELDEANNALGEANSTITSLQDELNTTQEGLRAVQDQLGTTEQERDALSAEVSTLESQLADAQAAADAAAAAGDANAAELQANADAIQEELNATVADLNAANDTIAGLETELGTTQEQLETTQQERDAAQTEVTDLTDQLNTTTADLETKTAEVETLNTTVELLNTEIETLADDLDDANTTVADLKDQLAKAKETNADNVADLESELKEAEDNAATIQNNLDTKTTELETANSTIETLNDEVETLNTTIGDLNTQLETKQGELDTANTSIADLTGKLEASKAATEAAIAEGVVNTEEAERVGYSGGFNVGYGEGEGAGLGKGLGAGAGLGSAIGLLGGFGMGQAQGGGGVPYTRPEAKDFMAKLNFNLPEAERVQQQQLQDYVGMLLGNMR
jgi:predicted  nucleic acid-binding Zn-ribbon protein